MIKLPAIKGIIRRRILLNYRVEPEEAEKILPPNFRPKLVNGYAIAGICLIRLEAIRPIGMPAITSLSSENSAHRIAVKWDDANGMPQEGVFVPRRDTDSRLNSLAGGRIFPGVHHFSKFTISDADGCISLRVDTEKNEPPLVDIQVNETDEFSEESIFSSLEESSDFFESGCIGYSSRPDSCTLDGLKLKVENWKVTPLKVDHIRSSYFDDTTIFPEGSIQFDHALLMRDIPHEWHSEPSMAADDNA